MCDVDVIRRACATQENGISMVGRWAPHSALNWSEIREPSLRQEPSAREKPHQRTACYGWKTPSPSFHSQEQVGILGWLVVGSVQFDAFGIPFSFLTLPFDVPTNLLFPAFV